MPTPLLFNPNNVNNDYKSLYGSRLTEEQINNKINDNFQAGKYDSDMVIPLVDANDFSEYITIIQPRPTKEEVELMFDSIKAEKDLTIKSQKDVFIDTMLRLRGNEINKIKEVNEDLFKGVQTLLLSVNKAVNEQIELLPEAVVEKPSRKPKEKKVIAPVVEEQSIVSEELPDFINKLPNKKDLPEQVMKLVVFRANQQDKFDIDLEESLLSMFTWKATQEGLDFWKKIYDDGDLREFKKRYGNKGEKVDEIIEFEDLTKFVETEILPKAPEVEKQEVKYVEVIVYPSMGGVLNIKVFNVVEMVGVFDYLSERLQMKELTFNFSAITDLGNYTTQIKVKTSESGQEIFENLIAKYDTFVEPKLDWKNFDNRKTDYERISLNTEILKDAFNPPPKPVKVEKPKPVVVEKPKPVVVEKPKPVPVEKPKQVPVEKPKPVPV
jgi:hypothetical protein